MKISTKGQVSIPKKIRDALYLKPGDELDFRIEGNNVVLIPVKTIKVPRDQEWFWTKEWQEKERESDEDIKEGRVYGPFSTVEEMKDSFKKEKKQLAKD
ncbi:MAG TPA: AbrB/MazE/SpoVT family DNA-binding domain-containing protein [Nitrospirae bacterium]|nr:AbrB/MazE/SpoVT family DNA-binding domain-containing protein [Nitrospirota bacterium]